ncbi:hypothetical protein Daesc_009346 [Daldinia eschscholtzii]|uniref:SET domain-containing protein n=1 Tax=Daldinia eschscholtzii TaxID=292717 RepID=A0AAX6MAP6_9PEZI
MPPSVSVDSEGRAPVATTDETITSEMLDQKYVEYQMECLRKLRQHMSWIAEWLAAHKSLCDTNDDAGIADEATGMVESDHNYGKSAAWSAMPTDAKSGTASYNAYRNDDKRGQTLGYVRNGNTTYDPWDDTKEPITIPHHLLDADEAAAESVGYGRIPYEHLANPESYVNQYIEVKKSQLGGYGVFAKTDLKCGQLILAEQPALKANPVTLYQDIAQLAPELQATFYRMHGHKRSPEHDERQAIFLTNAFAVKESSFVYFIAAKFNHACGQMRSVKYTITENNIIELRTAKDVPAGTELTISYGPVSPSNLYTLWGFRCACGGCKPLTDAQVKKLDCVDDVADGTCE